MNTNTNTEKNAVTLAVLTSEGVKTFIEFGFGNYYLNLKPFAGEELASQMLQVSHNEWQYTANGILVTLNRTDDGYFWTVTCEIRVY